MKTFKCDILCIGGGLSGVAFAWSLARKGKKTLLVEQNEFLGGTLVSSSMAEGLSHHKDSEFIKVFCSKMSSWNALIETSESIQIVNPEIVKMVLLEMCKEAEVDVLFHARPRSVEKKGQNISVCRVFGKGTIIEVEAGFFVDATGIGELAEISEVPEISHNPDRCSYVMSICNYNDGATKSLKLPKGYRLFPSTEEGRTLIKLPDVELESYDSESISDLSVHFAAECMKLLDSFRKDYKGFELCKISSVPSMLPIRNGKVFDINLLKNNSIDCHVSDDWKDYCCNNLKNLLIVGKAIGNTNYSEGDLAVISEKIAKSIN